RLDALTRTPERHENIAKSSEAFMYAVYVAGTTGARSEHQVRVYDYLEHLKKASGVTVLAGFGVSSPEQAHQLSNHCDGVIVGSKIVDLLYQGKNEDVQKLIQESVQTSVTK